MRGQSSPQRGFTYVGLLFAVFIMGLMLTVVSRVWSTTEQREREIQLLFVGHAYRLAISSYFSRGHRYPATLQDLIIDERFPVPFHHLRRLYTDPMTGQADWSLIRTPDGQGIMGVASTSQRAPIKRDGFEIVDEAFKDSDCYCSWKFVYYANRWNRTGSPASTPSSPPGLFQPTQPGTFPPASPTGPTTAPGIALPSTPPPAAPNGG